MCKVSRCNSTKLEAIQARHHTQHATTYNSAKLEQTPVMVELGRCAHHLHSYVDCPTLCSLANLVDHPMPYQFPSALLILHCEVKPTRKRNKIRSSKLIHAWYWWTLLWWKAKSWYEDGICTKNWTAWHIHTYDVVTKQKALQQIRSTIS